MTMYTTEGKKSLKALMLCADLKVYTLDLVTLNFELACDLSLVLAQQQIKPREYDNVVSWAHYNSQSDLLSVNFVGQSIQMFKLGRSAELQWSLPKNN
mgnify:CR=1 FL=1